MNILYVITILIMYILFMLMRKSEKQQNPIAWIAITTILIMCYNVFICLIYNFIGILCTLQNLSIANLIIIAIFSIILLKSKKIQKYNIKILDIVFAIVLLMIVIFIAYKQYGFPFRIKYEITDASTHFFYAEQFYKSSTLLYKIEANNIFGLYSSDFRLPGAYVNEGILFKIFEGIVENQDIFILFDLFVLYLSGILFYYLLKTSTKEGKRNQVIAIIGAVMYMLGYQLNSMLYGFVYLSLVLDIIIAFLLIMVKSEKKEMLNSVSLGILTLLSFGIFFSYAMFIPIIYIAFITNIIIKGITKQEKIFSEDNLMKVLLVIVNPLILGLTFFIILPLASGIKTEVSTLTLLGVNYENYITNFLGFIPIYIIAIIVAIKNKKKQMSFSTISLILSIIFVIIFWIGNKLNMVSRYYCFKVYYIIFPCALHNVYMILCNILEGENKKLKIGTYIYISIYLISIIISTALIKNIGINHIWYYNRERIKNERYILSSEEVEIFKEYKTLEKSEVYVLGSLYEGRLKWMTVLYDKNKIFYDVAHNERRTIEKWIEENDYKYYIAYYKDYNRLDENGANLEENSNEYNILHQNDYGFILERK